MANALFLIFVSLFVCSASAAAKLPPHKTEGRLWRESFSKISTPKKTDVNIPCSNPSFPDMSPPEQIHLSLASEQNAMTITWATPKALIAPPYVDYGLSVDNLPQNTTGTTTEWEYNGVRRFTHTVTLKNLEYNTIYYYQVGSNEQGWSNTYHFRTFPKGNDFPLRICVFGDLGYFNGTSTPYLQKAVQRREFDLVIHVGDIAYDLHTNDGAIGDAFLRQIEPIAAYVPYMVIAGNHEDDNANFTNYINRFKMPNSPLNDNQFYSVDVGPVHLMAISTEYHGYFFKYGVSTIYAQNTWLLRDAEIRNGYEQIPGFEDTLANVVDIGFWGHEHSYERLWPTSGKKVYNLTSNPYHNAAAPVYVITGSAGCYSGHAWFTDKKISMQPASVKRINDYGYSMVYVYNATHVKLEQISVEKNGEVIDSVWITKDVGHAPSKMLRKGQPFVAFPDTECKENEDRHFMSSCREIERQKFRAMMESIPP